MFSKILFGKSFITPHPLRFLSNLKGILNSSAFKRPNGNVLSNLVFSITKISIFFHNTFFTQSNLAEKEFIIMFLVVKLYILCSSD